MKRACTVVLLVLLAPAVGPAALMNNPILWETDFEPPDYTVGYLAPQQGWTEDWDNGTSDNRGQVVTSSGYGQVLYNYRESGQSPNHNYHSLGGVVDSGVVTLSFDARRVDTPNSTAWFNIQDSSNNHVTAVGMEVPSSTAGFRVFHSDGTFGSYGSLAWDTWYHLEMQLRLSGPQAGTYDLVARGPNGALAAELRDEPFHTPGALPEQLRVRTFGTGSGVEVDNIRYEQGPVINKIMHGDFDRLETGTWPNNNAPIGGWQINPHGDSTYGPETTDSNITIAEWPTGPAGNNALYLSTPGAGHSPYAGQVFAAPYKAGDHRLIVEFDHYATTANVSGFDLNLYGGTSSASEPDLDQRAASFGFRNEGSGGSTWIRSWSDQGHRNLASFDHETPYRVRVSTDLNTNTFDLFLRGGDYQRWTQVGKQLPFRYDTDYDRILGLALGTWNRQANGYVDNIVAASSADLPLGTIYKNDFEHYNFGDLVGQDGWIAGTGPGTAQVIDDAGTRMGQFTAATTANTYLYHDLDTVADAGQMAFRVDAHRSQTNGWAYFVLGDSDLSADDFTSSAATFGFYNGQFLVRPGDGAGNWSPSTARSDVSFAPDTWYTFLATVDLTGPDRNTWDLEVFERDTKNLVWTYSEAGFRTDFTDLTRLGMFASAGAGTLLFDNLRLDRVPEPAAVVILAFGVPMVLVRRRRH